MNIFSFIGKTYESSDISDIQAINEVSTDTVGIIRIMELGSLGDVIPLNAAESIREKLLQNKTQVMQLTNHLTFGTWTNVSNFVTTCMQIRYIPKNMIAIKTEMLIVDDIVALYRIEPSVSVMIIKDADFAAMQAQIFDMTWNFAHKLQIKDDGRTK